jgi:hypothetical protein
MSDHETQGDATAPRPASARRPQSRSRAARSAAAGYTAGRTTARCAVGRRQARPAPAARARRGAGGLLVPARPQNAPGDSHNSRSSGSTSAACRTGKSSRINSVRRLSTRREGKEKMPPETTHGPCPDCREPMKLVKDPPACRRATGNFRVLLLALQAGRDQGAGTDRPRSSYRQSLPCATTYLPMPRIWLPFLADLSLTMLRRRTDGELSLRWLTEKRSVI